MMRINITIFTI